MHEGYLKIIILALVIGIGSYSLAKRLKVPAILFYLLGGIIIGPAVLNLIDPRELKSGMPALIELAVAIILFEGGLSLPARHFGTVSGGIRRILLFALPLTGLLAMLLVHLTLGLSLRISVVFGALIVVTGPTVIGPLLKSVHLSRRIDIILRYEAIWGDCIGVLLSALALELVLIKDTSSLRIVALSFVSRIIIGTLLGAGGGFMLAKLLLPWSSRLGDRSLPGMLALAGALGIFWMSNVLIGSSGPLAAAVAGFTLSYLAGEDELHDIRLFKDQIAMVFISMLFVLLSAAIDPFEQSDLLPQMLFVAVAMGLLVRPFAVLLSLINTELNFREKLYVSLIGPRGIIAIATASYASFILTGYNKEMMTLLTTTFIVIFLSGSATTLFGAIFAKALKVSVTEYQSGIIFVGINPLSQALAKFAAKFTSVKFVDTNSINCLSMKGLGFETLCESALNDEIYSDAAEEGFRRAIIMTPNDALNELILRRAQAHFGMNNVFRVNPKEISKDGFSEQFAPQFTAFSDSFYLMPAIEALKNGSAEVKLLQPGAAIPETAFPLIEIKGEGVKIIRNNHKAEGVALYFVPTD